MEPLHTLREEYDMARPMVYFDTEIKSDVPIDYGRHRFLHGKEADYKCMAWSINSLPTKLWIPGMAVPSPFSDPRGYDFTAFNIQFDQLANNIVGRRYGFKEIPLDRCHDVMAVAARFGLPQGLANLGDALGVKLPKLSTGRELVKLFCTPPFCNPKKDEMWHQMKFRQLCEYCMRDVDSMKEIINKMPMSGLSESEQHIWQVTAEINATGVPVDHAAVVRINQVVDYYREKEAKKVPLITGGQVQTVGQIKKILVWCGEQGIEMENLQVDTVQQTIDDMLDEDSIVPYNKSVIEILQLRQRLGGAAVKKFKRLENMTLDGRIMDNLRYHGAGTGRTTGGGFQMLNMPRAKVKPPKGVTYEEAVEDVVESFYNTTVLQHPQPLEQAKALVRPMIRAKKGKIIMAADWSSIEYILLMWFAGEHEKVERFRAGYDPYMDFATKLFNVEYDAVTGDQRQHSKAPVLGAGYMLGATSLIDYAEGYGVTMTKEESEYATNFYRNEHPRVKRSWYALKDCAHNAVRNHGVPYGTHRTTFKVIYDRAGTHWLKMKLPSGRSLYYCQPRLVAGKYGPVIKHRGVDPDTKRWTWIYLKPQRIIENVIQGLGRDILNDGVDRIRAVEYNPVAHVYDEIICEEPEECAEERLIQMTRLMCVPSSWCPDLPLFAEGFVAKRYKKN